MPKARVVALAATLSLLGAILPGSTSVAKPQDVFVIDSSTRFTASKTSMMRVRFRHPVKTADLHSHIRGNGRLYGYLMRKVGDYGDTRGPKQEGTRPFIRAVTTGQCTKPGCRAKHDRFFLETRYNVGNKVAGLWDFYIVADGSPVSVTLKIEGSKSQKSVRVSGPVISEMRTLTPRVHETATNTIYSAGDFSKLKEPDFGAIALWTIGAPHGATAYGACHFRRQESVPEEVRLVPGCPLGYGSPAVWPAPGDRGGIVTVSRMDSTTRGLNGWYATTSVVERYGAVGLWIDYPEVNMEELYEGDDPLGR